MIAPKYFERVRQLRRINPFTELSPPRPFSIDDLEPKGVFARLGAWLAGLAFKIIIPILREGFPVFRFGRFAIVTRMSDVLDVLAQDDVFKVPYGPEMRELGGGANFVLGEDGARHADQNALIRRVFRPADLAGLKAETRRISKALIASSAGRIDVMRDLITRTATETCAGYFGLDVKEPDAFAEWAMGVSGMLFADPTGDETKRRLGLYGASRVREVVDRAISQALEREIRKRPDDSLIVDRLLADPELRAMPASDRRRRARTILVGLVTGFVPTTALAAGNILSELLRRPKVLRQAMACARADDRAGLEAILWEAARLNPALNPGQWRIAAKAGVIGRHGAHATPVPAGTVISVATASALRDPRAFSHPNAFDATRPVGGGMLAGEVMFGAGVHKCLGQHITLTQMAEIFAVLLAQPNLQRAKGRDGRLVTAGPYPRRLDMTFDAPVAPAVQSMVIIAAPVMPGVALKALQGDIQKQLGDPLGPRQLPNKAVAAALDATGVIHFASLSAIDVGTKGKPALHLMLELNVDGPQAAAIDAFVEHTGDLFKPFFDTYAVNPQGLPFASLLKARALKLHSYPWGATGLDFNGTPEFAVADIERQAALARFARAALDLHLRDRRRSARPMAALDYVRGLIRDAKRLEAAARKDARLRDLQSRREEFADFLIRPSRRRLRISDWKEPQGFEAPWQVAKGRAGQTLAALIVLLVLAFSFLNYLALGASGVEGLLGRIGLAFGGGVFSVALVLGLVYGAALVLLRRTEAADLPDQRHPGLDHMRDVAEVENHRGYAQNHFMAVTELKPGWVRRATLALALWGVKQLVTYWFRPGFVLNMGTIHYAKWFRLPGAGKLIFLANYDGSWESYLEDFIMRAHQGQTAVWSNGLGFPDTRFLVGEGAQDGDMFKRWVRRQQVVTQFWYARFPALTTDQIRNNALIHDGLARAGTDTAARAWLDCFGSMQRPDYAIETDEVQSLVFRGMGEMPYAICALVRLPSAHHDRRAFLGMMLGDGAPRPAAIPPLRFGDRTARPGERSACFMAFSARGLKALGLPCQDGEPGLASFPSAFNVGMDRRRRVLGDREDQSWAWSDDEVDVAVLVYGPDMQACRDAVAAMDKAMKGDGRILRTVETEPAPAPERPGPLKPEYEHFGFRDGISQPVIRGTRRFAQGAALRDVVEPGEFLFGYRANQGYFPPSPAVAAVTDVGDRLPIAEAETPDRFPDFGANTPSTAHRDFGRNGSFLVIRQLAQKVDGPDGFKAFTDKAAARLNAHYPGLAAVLGETIDGDWIAAKMMGRRKDGSPLIGPTAQRARGDVLPRHDRTIRGDPAFTEDLRTKLDRFFELFPGGFSAGGDGGDAGGPIQQGPAPRPPAYPSDPDGMAQAAAPAPKVQIASGPGAATPSDDKVVVPFPDPPTGDASSATTPEDISRVAGPLSHAVRVGTPDPVPAQPVVDPENDFTFGLDDPRGLQCPLGAHIRRANPRDSLQPGDATELEITNRHRILRRGRTYQNGEEKGLLFMALCADLERQFEFVQQTWVGSPSFHGLADEPDPIAAGPDALPRRDGTKPEQVFTIPTPVGAVTVRNLKSFVSTRAGGYFFLPSRSALAYLHSLPPS